MAAHELTTITRPFQGEVLPAPTDAALEAHRQGLLQAAIDLQAGTIYVAEAKRITAASREFHRRIKAWQKAGNAVDVETLRGFGQALTAVEKLALPATTTRAKSKLTEAAIGRLKPPAKGRIQIPDGFVTGLWLRISDRDVRSWSAVYRLPGRSAPQRLTLGKWPAIGVAEARKLASEVLLAAARGEDPAAAKRAERESDRFEDVAAEFVKRVYRKRGLRSTPETEAAIRNYLLPAWSGRRIGAIGKADVIKMIDKISDAGHERQANRVLQLARQLFGWCEQRGLVDRNPAAAIAKPHREVSRDRVLEDHELAAIWRAVDGGMGWPWSPLVKLLVLTGQRRNEVAGMAWADLNLEVGTWSLRAEQTKMARARTLPLSGAAVEILAGLPRIAGSALVFPANRCGSSNSIAGFSKMKRRLDQLSGVSNWRLHDLRRTFATMQQQLGTRLDVTEQLLGHVAGSRAGVIAIYQRYDFQPEQRVAVERLAERVGRLTGGAAGKVVKLA